MKLRKSGNTVFTYQGLETTNVCLAHVRGPQRLTPNDFADPWPSLQHH